MRSFIFSVCIGLLLAGQAWAVFESEPNNSRSEATQLSIPGNAQGGFANDGSQFLDDYFRFTVAAPGTWVFSGNVTGGLLSGADLGLEIRNASDAVIASSISGGVGAPEVIEFAFTTAGTYYLVAYEETMTPNAISSYNIAITEVAGPDVTAPTWVGAIPGIDTVTRLQGNTSANVTWHAATDNVTDLIAIRFDIYYSTEQANVFTEGVKKIVSSSLSTTLTGLTATATYYVAVRARDEVGNRDTNTRVLQLAPLPNAARSWEFYE